MWAGSWRRRSTNWRNLPIINRKPHAVSFRQATLRTAFWVFLAIIFAASIYFWRGSHDALDFLTAYIIELSLSLDNLVVFVVIFT